MSYNEIALQEAGKQHKSELAAKDAEIAALREANAKLHQARKTHDDYIQESSALKDKHIRNIQRQAKIEVLCEVSEYASADTCHWFGDIQQKLKELEATK